MAKNHKTHEHFPWLKSRSLVTWLLVGFAILLLGVIIVFLKFPKKSDTVTVSSVQVAKGTILKTVTATGKVVPNFEVEIKAKASGKIIRLPYDVGDYVPKGALLVQLDPIDENRNVSQALASLSSLESKTAQSQVNLRVAQRTLSTDLARAKADLAAAQAKANDAHAKAQRLSTLAQQRYISQEEAETGRTTEAQSITDYQNAKTHLQELQTEQLALQSQAQDVRFTAAQVRAQRVALAQAKQRLSETKIYAPISGVVTARAGQIGNIVGSGVNNVGGGTAIMMLADLSQIYVMASVDESDIGQVRNGQLVNITADAYPGQTFKGRVVRIAPEGFEEANVVTFEVKIEVLGANSHILKPSMTTNVEIVLTQRPNVLKVPVEAVQSEKQGGSFVMLKNRDGQFYRQPVVLGINNGIEVEVVQGLKVGESVANEQGQAPSRWRKEQAKAPAGSQNVTRRSQSIMMRGLGGGGKR